MTPDRIAQLRQLLQPILEIPWQPSPKRGFGGYTVEIDADDKDLIVGSIQEALALLPCETCNGAGKVPTAQSRGFGKENEIMDTCPDCKNSN